MKAWSKHRAGKHRADRRAPIAPISVAVVALLLALNDAIAALGEPAHHLQNSARASDPSRLFRLTHSSQEHLSFTAA